MAAHPGIVQIGGRDTDILRRNRVQAELAEAYEVSQSTISRAIAGMTPLLGEVLGKYVPTADELDGRTQCRGC